MSGDDYLSFSQDTAGSSSTRPYRNDRNSQHARNRNRFHDHSEGQFFSFPSNSGPSDYNTQPYSNQRYPGGNRFRGKSNNRPRNGFGYQPQNQNQHRNMNSNFKKEANISDYVHPSMTEDPWSMFEVSALNPPVASDDVNRSDRDDDMS